MRVVSILELPTFTDQSVPDPFPDSGENLVSSLPCPIRHDLLPHARGGNVDDILQSIEIYLKTFFSLIIDKNTVFTSSSFIYVKAFPFSSQSISSDCDDYYE